MTIKDILKSIVAGERTVADVVAMTEYHEGLRGYSLWDETPEESKTLWAIQAALPKRQTTPYRCDPEATRKSRADREAEEE